ncbi:hypothetical protein AX16_006436 [Volvariella volvacea WC 439]|nr:hypothetical protein AX16_006436 [Volvariella volvacea WC 439]
MASPPDPSSGRIRPGHGRISLVSHGSRLTFAQLSSAYPLKLLSARLMAPDVALVYLLTYGGGLVGGDQICLEVDIGVGSKLVMLSQGSTKVFRTRPGYRWASVHEDRSHVSAIPPSPVLTTRQTMDVSIQGALFLLPDPVTCFRAASYDQIQKFRLSTDASAIILDWVTSGRRTLGEEWAFSRYYSSNELWVDGKRIVKDVMLLETEESNSQLPPRSLSDKLAPYTCYATLILVGPLLCHTLEFITSQYDRITVFRGALPQDIIWSLSHCGQGVALIRVAGKETEMVRKWLKQHLSHAETVIGAEAFRKAFA